MPRLYLRGLGITASLDFKIWDKESFIQNSVGFHIESHSIVPLQVYAKNYKSVGAAATLYWKDKQHHHHHHISSSSSSSSRTIMVAIITTLLSASIPPPYQILIEVSIKMAILWDVTP